MSDETMPDELFVTPLLNGYMGHKKAMHWKVEESYTKTSLQDKAIRLAVNEALKEVFPALDRAMALCDLIPTKLQNHPDTFVSDIGEAVNGKDGYYSVIRDAFEKVRAINNLKSEEGK